VSKCKCAAIIFITLMSTVHYCGCRRWQLLLKRKRRW